jgi:hypothetical protein
MSGTEENQFAHYEYEMEEFTSNAVNSGEFLEVINEYAEAGWRLAFVAPGGGRMHLYTIFERALYYE